MLFPKDKGFRLITLQEAMSVFGISRATIDRWRRSKQLPTIKIGKEVFFDPDELQMWIKSHSVCGAAADRPESAPAESLTVSIGYQSGTAHMWSPLIMKELGFFEEELRKQFPHRPIKVLWHNAENGLELVEGLISGLIQIASLGDYPIRICSSLGKLLPNFQPVLLAFDGKTRNGKGISVVVPSNSIIRKPDDLANVTISTVANSSAGMRLNRLLTSIGAAEQEHPNVIHRSMSESLTDIVDRRVGASAMWEPYLSLLRHWGAGTVLFEEGMYEDYLTGLVAGERWAANNEAIVIAYLKAHVRVHQLMRSEPASAAKRVQASTGIPQTVAWRVLSNVRWDAAVYPRDLNTLQRLEERFPGMAPELYPIRAKTDYLNIALEEMGLPSIEASPQGTEWPREQMY